MFLSWWRGLVQSATSRKKLASRRRPALPRRFRAAISLEQLEVRIVPVAGSANVFLNVGSAITQVNTVTGARSNTIPVFVDFDTLSLGSNGGLSVGSYYVVYDPTVLSISQSGSSPGADIKLGSAFTGTSGYTLVNSSTGSSGYEVGVVAVSINHSGSSFVTGAVTGHLLELDFHVLPSISVGITTLLDLEASYNDGLSNHLTSQSDKIIPTKYNLFEAGSSSVPLTTYPGSLTQAGALTPSTCIPADSDTSDATIRIEALTPNQAPTAVADSFSIAPNTSDFPPGTMSIAGSAGVLANDTRTSNGPMYADMVGTGITTAPPAVVAVSDLIENGSTVTVTTSVPHTYIFGESINISRAPTSGYNGFFTITSVLSDTQFTYTNTTQGLDEDSSGKAQVLVNATLFTQNTAHGVLTFNGNDGSLSYTPTSGFVGVDSFTYQAVDAVSNTPSPTVTATIYVGGYLYVPQNLIPTSGTVVVPVNIASGNPTNSGGLANATIGLNYDANVLSFDHAEPGSLNSAAGWTQFTVTNANNDPNAGLGQIIITASDTGGASPLTTSAGGSLALVTFNVIGSPTGSTVINLSSNHPAQSSLDVAAIDTPRVLPFAITPLDETDPAWTGPQLTDGIVSFASGPIATTTNLTVTAGGFSFSTLTYGTQITLKATVSPNAGTNAPSVGQVDFKDGSTDLGLVGTSGAVLVGSAEVYTLVTPAKQLNASGLTHIISAAYTDNLDSNYSASTGTQVGSFVVAPKNLTVTTLTATKAYDTNTSATPTPTVSGLVTGDTASGFTESFDNKNAGTGKTMTLNGGYVITDGNSGNNYTVVPAQNTTGKITQRSLTVTAGTDTKGYDGTTSSSVTPAITGGSLLGGDTAAFVQLFDTKNVGTGKTMSVGGSVNDGNNGGNYAVTAVTNTSGKITARAITVSAVTSTKVYDGTLAGGVTPVISSGSIATGDINAFIDSFDTKNVGTGKTLTLSGSANDGNGGNNYAVTLGAADTTGAITVRAVTVTAATSTKGYDGTNSASAIPTFTTGSLATGDSASFTETYDSRNAGTGKTLTPAGAITDGNGGNNYAVTLASNTTGAIAARAIAVTAATSTRVYDGTTAGGATPSVTVGTLASGDTAAFVESFTTKHAGTAKTLTPSGSVNDGNSGNNYAVSLVTDTTGNITQRLITVTATTNTKAFDTNASASAIPTVTGGNIASGDSPHFSETYNDPSVNTGKTLVPTGTVTDGNSGNNYGVTFQNDATGVITSTVATPTSTTVSATVGGSMVTTVTYGTQVTLTATVSGSGTAPSIGQVDFMDGTTDLGFNTASSQTSSTAVFTLVTSARQLQVIAANGGVHTITASYHDNVDVNFLDSNASLSGGLGVTARAITVTAATNTKGYDANTSASATASVTSGSLVAGDTAAFTETYDTRHVGTAKTLSAAGSVGDGNSGNDYNVTFVKDTTGKITGRAITVSAATSTKVYDSTTASSATPTVTGTLASGDSPAFTVTFDNRNAGSNKTLTPTGSVNDGNSGNDYTVTSVSDATGIIFARLITVTAASNSKAYDGGVNATVTPTVTGGSLAGNDRNAITESYDTKNIGIGKTLTLAGSISDGNFGSNYSLTFMINTTGVITARAITILAGANTKGYDGTISAATLPTLSGGSLLAGDTAAFTEVYDTKHVATGKTLTVTGSVNDGNGGSNYAVTTISNTSGQITVRAITVSAISVTRAYDGTTNSVPIPSIMGGSLATGDFNVFFQTFDTKNVGTGKTLTVGGSIGDGNGGGDYSVTLAAPDTTGKITPRLLGITAASSTRSFDGTTTSSGIPTVTTGSFVAGDTGVFTESYDNKNAGTGKTLIPTGSVNDGNGGHNYGMTFNNNTTGVITARALTVTAATSTKAYDGTTSSSAIPTVTSGALAAGDSITGLSETYDTSTLGTGKTLTVNPGYTVNDGNSGHNYAVSLATSNNGAIVSGPFAKYVISILGGSNVTAGSAFIINVQASDSFGNPVSSYSGPSDVIVTTNNNDPLGNFPFSGTVLSIGTGYFLGSFKTVGTYTITATAGSFSGTSDPITVRAGTAVYFTAIAPANTLTGNATNTTVTAYDLYNNVATGYTGHVHFTTSDSKASLPPDSALTNGVGTFGVVLKTPGTQTITATDAISAAPRPITGRTGPIVTRGLEVTGFTPRADGFVVNFNKPFVPGDLALYGPTLARLPDVTLAAPNPIGGIHGSLVADPSNMSLTFKATESYLAQIINGDGSVFLPDATYTVTLVAGSGGQGFLDSLGGGLDGLANGTVHNFTMTFTTHYHANNTPVLAIPDFARGPDDNAMLVVPNDVSYGIPIKLFNAQNVKNVTFTLAYDPALLKVLGAFTGINSDATDPNASFALVSDSGGLATFTYNDSTPESGTVVLGDISAQVPSSAKNLYQVKELLNLNVLSSDGGVGTVTESGLHINAYLADVNADHAINGLDKLLTDTVSQGRATGFSAYAQLDPVIIGDVASAGQVDPSSVAGVDIFTSGNPPGSGQSQIPVPPGLAGITSPGAADPTLSLFGEPTGVSPHVTVNVEDPHPAGSTGLTEAVLAFKYDPSVLTVSASDITLGTIPSSGAGWQFSLIVIDQTTGQIGVELYSQTPVTTTQAGSLVTIDFHPQPGASASGTVVSLVDSVQPLGKYFATLLADTQSAMVLTPALVERVFANLTL